MFLISEKSEARVLKKVVLKKKKECKRFFVVLDNNVHLAIISELAYKKCEISLCP